MKLLIVEDNLRLAQDMQQFLVENGFVVERTATLAEASEKVGVYQYDLVIIDIGLPDGSGLDLIRAIKENQEAAGILILTAKAAIEEKVKGLNLGAEDYMTKPFHQAELNARIHSILRRHKFNRSNVVFGSLIPAFILLAVGVVIFNYVLSGYFFRPFNKILDVMKSYQVGQQTDIAKIDTNTVEFQKMQDLFHQMIERIEYDYRRLKEYTENVAHKMQTPLSIIRNWSDVTHDN